MRPMLPRLAGLLRGRPSAGAFRSTAVRYFSSAGGTTGHRAFAFTGVVAAGAAGLSLWAGCGQVTLCGNAHNLIGSTCKHKVLWFYVWSTTNAV